jgi:hypothetical protein
MAAHKDMQGRTLRVGDTVAYVSYHNGNSLVIGRVQDLKKVRAEVMTTSSGWLGGDAVETIRSDQLIKLTTVKAPKSKSAKIFAFPKQTA